MRLRFLAWGFVAFLTVRTTATMKVSPKIAHAPAVTLFPIWDVKLGLGRKGILCKILQIKGNTSLTVIQYIDLDGSKDY